MILHILDEEKFLTKAVSIFQDCFPGKNVFLIGFDPTKDFQRPKISPKNDTIIFSAKNSKEYRDQFRTYLQSADMVFYHNLYKTYKLKLLKFVPRTTMVVWYFWGAELYGLNPSIENLMPLTRRWYIKNLSLAQYIRKEILARFKKAYYWRLFKKGVQEKVNYVLTNIVEDIELLETYTGHIAHKGWFTYYSAGNELPMLSKNSDKINILIGNSSSETNNHLDAFKMIESENLADRKIFIPLNYGDEKYQKVVSSEAHKLFGEKAIPLLDFMKLEEYYSMLNSCSIVIMNHKRQQAFNTIMMAIAMGCKVFLREENTIYKCLKREGFKVYSIQEYLDGNSLLQALDRTDQIQNSQRVKKLYAYDKVRQKIKQQILEIRGEGN